MYGSCWSVPRLGLRFGSLRTTSEIHGCSINRKINERNIDGSKRVYPMESNVFDVVSRTSSSSHCPLSPLKINPKGVYPMELTLKVELHIPECRPKSFDRSCWCARLFRAAWADDCVADLKPEIFCFRAGSVEPTRMERETFQCGGTWTLGDTGAHWGFWVWIFDDLDGN